MPKLPEPVEMSPEEAAELERAARRFREALLEQKDFEPLVRSFFSDDIAEHPYRMGMDLLRVHEAVRAEADKPLLMRFAQASLNFAFYYGVHMFSQWKPGTKPEASEVDRLPATAEQYLKEKGLEARDFMSTSHQVETLAEMTEWLGHIEAINQRLRREIEDQSLIKSQNFQHGLAQLNKGGLLLVWPRKERVIEPYEGYPAGTMLYVTSELFYLLIFVRQNGQLKLSAIGPVKH